MLAVINRLDRLAYIEQTNCKSSTHIVSDLACFVFQNFAEIMECLRNADVNKLVTNQWKNYKHMTDFPFAPVVDGTFLPDHPQTLLMGGKAKRADLLLGTVEDEGYPNIHGCPGPPPFLSC